MNFVELKRAIELASGLSEDALHIYAAILIQLVVAAAVRRSLAHPVPWLAVLLFEFVNEWMDIRSDGRFEEWEKWASLHDLWNTILLPTVLLLIARFLPALLRPAPAPRREDSGPDG